MKNIRNNKSLKELNQLNEIKITPEYNHIPTNTTDNDALPTSPDDHKLVEMENEEEQNDAPFLLTVEIDKGQTKQLKLYHDSIPEEVAFEFCKKYNLDFMANDYLLNEVKKLLEGEKTNSASKQETEMNINFSETIQEVDEEYISSDLHRKDSDRGKNIEHQNLVADRKEILLIDGKRFKNDNSKDNGSSKVNYSPFVTENSSQGDNGLINILKRSKGEQLAKSADFKNKKSKSLKDMMMTSAKSSKTFIRRTQSNNKNETRLKSDFEIRCERIKRLREIKSYFSHTFNSQFQIPPPIYDFSMLKSRILSNNNLLQQSTNYVSKRNESIKKLKDKLESGQEKLNFSPKINKNSEKILKERLARSPESNVFENLYENALKRSARLETMRTEFHDQFNFKPTTNQQKSLLINTPFQDRQTNFLKKVEEKRRKYFRS